MLEEAWAPEYTYVGIIVDVESIQKLQVRSLGDVSEDTDIDCAFHLTQLELTLDDIKWAIVRAKKLKIKPDVMYLISHRSS